MRALRPLLVLGIAAGCTGRVGEALPEPTGVDPNQPNPVDPNQPPSNPPVDVCAGAPRDPGRVTIHRLNRAEYDNTVRDLIGTAQRPAAVFPSDDHGYGFDNIADVLAMAPLLAEKYQLAAEGLVEEIFEKPFDGPTTQQAEAEDLTGSAGGVAGSYWNLYSNGELSHRFTVDLAGRYEVSTRLYGQQAGTEAAKAELTLDGLSLGTFDVPETENAPRTITLSADLQPGLHTFSVAFTNDYYEAPNDRNLLVDWLRAVGPLDYNAPPTNESAYRKVMVCTPAGRVDEACARQILTTFARRAWRRPVTPEETDRLYALANVVYAEGDDFETGLKVALQGVLLSPHFLYRVELDANPTSLTPHPLSAHELASRLSYFLWSSMPDDQLLAKADDGTLLDLAVLRAEAARMLADPKAVALVDNFAGQWLYTRRVDDVLPDPAVYPDFDDELRAAMGAETRAFFESFLAERRNVLELLDADYTFLNDRLARHYGLPAPGSNELVRVQLPAGQRGGILTQASILTVTSRPKRTAPVVRGKWILEQLLCQAPPPPPPGVEGFPETVEGSVRERLEAHRRDPTCNSCHGVMDPLGLALEHFDGIGSYRTMDGTTPVDATGQLPDGRSFDGARELAQTLRTDPKTPRCMTERAFIYALGRGAETFDRCSLSDMTANFNAGGNTFEALVAALVTHSTFTSRRGEAP